MAVIKKDGQLIALNVNPTAFFMKLEADGLETNGYEVLKDAEELAAERKKKQLTGIEFSGVMCSATAEDQNGLDSLLLQHTIAKLTNAQLPDNYFRFKNGNILLINSENIEALDAVWRPFRMSFFPSPESNV